MNISPEIFQWVILPLLIFLSRVVDVSLGTIRVVFISKGLKYIAPVVGFFEILIWILAIGQIMQNLNNPICYIAYALGFSSGNFLGMLIAEKLSLGVVLMRVILKSSDDLVAALRENNYGATVLDGKGAHGPVKIIYSIISRKDVAEIVDIIKTINPKAFYTIEEVGYAKEGVFPIRKRMFNIQDFAASRPFRKGK